jgi:tetratricopeptide (TPR) repeat protein
MGAGTFARLAGVLAGAGLGLGLIVGAARPVAAAPRTRAGTASAGTGTGTNTRTAASPTDGAKADTAAPDDPIARYFTELEASKLIDVESGNLQTLTRELGAAETLLRDGAFTDFVEYQNAEYDLAIALAKAGALGASLETIDGILRRGPAAPYWGPAHRRAVDIALETRDHAGVLARLEAIKTADPIPPSAAGERAYLRGRAAYDSDKLADAEGELVTISKKSRLYSSAIYLRGVIRARRGEYRGAAEAMCEIAATPDNDKFAFVVDERYFTIKDLARLGLGRLAHEQGEYDDAYYHYFQVPEDSSYLPDALFEASWSMYQKRELGTARDLVKEFLKEFPTSPLWPEASLLAGYVELADCKFDDSQAWYDKLVARLTPVVDEMDRIRKDPTQRRLLFARAVTRFREIKQTGAIAGAKPSTAAATRPEDDVLGLLRLDPRFVRLNDAVTGMHELAGSSAAVIRGWQGLANQITAQKVAAVSGEKTLAQEQLADANALVEDYRRLVDTISHERGELERGRAEGTVPADVAIGESDRLATLLGKTTTALERAVTAADAAGKAASDAAAPGIRPLIQQDLADARRLDHAAHDVELRLTAAADQLAAASLERLYQQTRRVLDKARLGKVDAVIGQKRKLDIEVQDLAAGRLPAELVGRLWNAGMIGDDEEYWPLQGEYWADEYEGWR